MLKLVVFLLLLTITCRNVQSNTAGHEQAPLVEDQGKKIPNPSKEVSVNINVPEQKHVEESEKETKPKETDKKSTKSTTLAPIPLRPNSKNDLLQSGALLRGFYVFLGLSVLTVFYFVYRSYRLRHGSQPATTVKKYGVTARRSDMEMRHLELDDDDDDTLFEVNTVNR